MTFRVLHFANDEKFIPLVQGLFEEALPGASQFRVHAEGGPLRRVTPGPGVVQVDRSYFRSPEVASDLGRCECLVIHGLTPYFAPALRAVPDPVLVMWCGWGFDYYGLVEKAIGPLVLPRTRRLALGATTLDRIRYLADTPSPLVKLWRGLARALSRPERDPLEACAARFDLFSVAPADVALVKSAVPALAAEYHPLLYATTEDTLAVGPDRMAGPDILVGNSATPTNNHAEAFDALARMDLAGRRIVVPLSYGSAAYADAVMRLGRRRFGSAFVPVRTFMPLAEFNELQKDCGTVIMNHRRLQALGTFSTALYKGAKVFLRRENPVFDYYSRMGITLASVDELGPPSDRALVPLTDEQRSRNRALLGAHFSRASAIDGIRQLAARRRHAPAA